MSNKLERQKLNTAEAALLVGISSTLLSTLRQRGEGPAYYRIGKSILYDRVDLESWLKSQRQPTAA